MTELLTEKQIAAHTQDLSAYGCFIETVTPFSAETKVRLRISRGGQQFVAQGKVSYSRPGVGNRSHSSLIRSVRARPLPQLTRLDGRNSAHAGEAGKRVRCRSALCNS